MSKHKSRYKLWLCLGYTMDKTAIVAIDIVSAADKDDAAREFFGKPELADAPIAVTEIQHIATGNLERHWRLLRYQRS